MSTAPNMPRKPVSNIPLAPGQVWRPMQGKHKGPITVGRPNSIGFFLVTYASDSRGWRSVESLTAWIARHAAVLETEGWGE